MATSILSKIRSNRKELRQRGCTPSMLLMLEAVAYQAPNGMARLSVAAVGRLVGISRSVALRHMQKLEAIGAVIRIGSGIMLNIQGILKWCAEACVNRAAHLKRLFLKKKSQSVAHRTTHRGSINSNPSETSEPQPQTEEIDRHSALQALAATYIPVHMRRNH